MDSWPPLWGQWCCPQNAVALWIKIQFGMISCIQVSVGCWPTWPLGEQLWAAKKESSSERNGKWHKAYIWYYLIISQKWSMWDIRAEDPVPNCKGPRSSWTFIQLKTIEPQLNLIKNIGKTIWNFQKNIWSYCDCLPSIAHVQAPWGSVDN